MIVWVDAQLSPRIAQWLSERFEVEAIPVRELGLREASTCGFTTLRGRLAPL